VFYAWSGNTLGAGSFTDSGPFRVSTGAVERICRESGTGTGAGSGEATATGSGEATGEATATGSGEATDAELRKKGRQGRQVTRATGTKAT